MTKIIYAFLLLCLFSCGEQSSPDGRSRSRDAVIQRQLDSLKLQTRALQDSITRISRQLNAAK
ncbi:hypothetical protein EOD41_04255 [Mucilaginibacter limnophilus]|uniref:Uncharacterized protein n=1 Tax=Mucilaginibacter limnophilus TaxID=1932778 RepID=A0A3S2UPX1_9SPHI|nr:hypothetical protein [Mucilaginibacter limnophilus]RVU03151.1 hypothetical protein EOD41_04255 [Mucilaginibacter limnophilus]